MLSTVKLKYPHPDGSIGIFPWLADLPSLLQRGLYADVVLHPMKFEKNSSGKKLKNIDFKLLLFCVIVHPLILLIR